MTAALRQKEAFISVRKIWDIFVSQCTLNYVPGSNLTADEELLGFCGRCPFCMYIRNKLDKYGIKFPMMLDARTMYKVDVMLYY